MVTDQVTENDVVSLAANYLKSEGWTVHRALTVNQKGVDLYAERGGLLLYAEAKGAAHASRIDSYS
jgi:Holliday junction resolvase